MGAEGEGVISLEGLGGGQWAWQCDSIRTPADSCDLISESLFLSRPRLTSCCNPRKTVIVTSPTREAFFEGVAPRCIYRTDAVAVAGISFDVRPAGHARLIADFLLKSDCRIRAHADL